jgi:excisionase family DNA binding protein
MDLRDDFYTIDEVAELFKVTRTTVYDWMKSEQLKFVKVGGRRRITRQAINEFIREGRPEDLESEDQKNQETELLAA